MSSTTEVVEVIPELKVYELLPHMDADAPVYQAIGNNQREKITKIPFHRPALRITFMDTDGKSKTIRYKEMSNSVYQDVQINEEKIPANEPFSTNEYNALRFKHGRLITDDPNVQKFLESHPEFEGFKGKCRDVDKPKYKLVNEEVDAEVELDDFEKRLKAGNRINAITDLQEAKNLLIKVNGGVFETPDSLRKCKTMLIAFMDDTNDAGLDALIEKEDSAEDKLRVLVGNAVNAGMISFDEKPGYVQRKVADKWVDIKIISSDKPAEERVNDFVEFLGTEDGKKLTTDLEKELKKVSKK